MLHATLMVLPHLNLNSSPSIKCLHSPHLYLLQRVTFVIFCISVNLAFVSNFFKLFGWRLLLYDFIRFQNFLHTSVSF